MRKHILALLSAAVAACSIGTASAADLPRKAPPAVVPLGPAVNWSGFYIGAHVGAAWGTIESQLSGIEFVRDGGIQGLTFPVSSHTVNGFLGGGQIGWNFQSGVWVIGIEAQGSWADIDGKTPCVLVLTCRTDIDWVVTLAGRLGFTADKALIYVKGGVAWAKSEYSAAFDIGVGPVLSVSAEDTRTGLMLGAGVEYQFLPNWSAKIEYNYIDFRDEDLRFPLAIRGETRLAFDANIEQKLHLIKFGLNYRWGWGGWTN